MTRRLTLAVLLLLAPAVPAEASFPVMQEMRCPIGGERFEYQTTVTYSTFGIRPDGMPYSSWVFPNPLPECPGNGLIVYKERFSRDERRQLAALIASDAYRALRTGETQYYRLAWLLREMGAPPAEQIWVLAQASWQPPIGSALRDRYLGELAEASAALGGEPTDLAALARRGRWINALRELGRFNEAGALLARTDLAAIDSIASDAEQGQQARAYFAMQRTLVDRRDGSAEPLDFLPARQAAFICADPSSVLDDRQRAYCETDAMRDEVEQARAFLADPDASVQALIEDIERAAEDMRRVAEEVTERPN